MTRVILFLVSCMAALLCGCSMPGNAVRPDKPRAVKQLQVDGPIDELEASSAVNVVYTLASPHEGVNVKIEGPGNLLDYIVVEKKGRKLVCKVDSKGNNVNINGVTVFVSMPPVSSIAVSSAANVTVDYDYNSDKPLTLYASSAGSIDMENVFLPENACLDITASSAASIDIDGAIVGSLKGNISSAADVDIDHLTADTATIQCSSSAKFETDARVNVLTASSSSAADMEISGVAGNASLSASSNGKIDADELDAKQISVSEDWQSGGKICGFGKEPRNCGNVREYDNEDDIYGSSKAAVKTEQKAAKAQQVKLEMPEL